MRGNVIDYFIKHQSFHHIETRQLTCCTKQLTGFYMMSVLEFNVFKKPIANFQLNKKLKKSEKYCKN